MVPFEQLFNMSVYITDNRGYIFEMEDGRTYSLSDHVDAYEFFAQMLHRWANDNEADAAPKSELNSAETGATLV